MIRALFCDVCVFGWLHRAHLASSLDDFEEKGGREGDGDRVRVGHFVGSSIFDGEDLHPHTENDTNSEAQGSQQQTNAGKGTAATMELTPEDDDLLSYFLSADVASEDLPPQPKTDAANAAGTAPLYPTLGGGVGVPANASAGSEQFTFGDRAFGQAAGSAAGSTSGSAAASGNLATPGPLSTLQQMQNAYHAAENAMMRSSSADEDAMSGAGLDSDEKRQRRCVCVGGGGITLVVVASYVD